MHNLFVSCPSARGVLPATMWSVFDARTQVEAAGHRLHGAGVYRQPLDLARNEMVTVFLSTICDQNLLLDDDCQVAPEWVPRMMRALDAPGCDIISAPCLLRDHSHGGAQSARLFNIRPMGMLVEMGGLRLLECEQTGLGAVMVNRKVIEALHAADKPHYASRLMPGHMSAAIFTSQVVKATDLIDTAPEGMHVHTLDDVVFSRKVLKLGFKIHAAIDVPTVHDGMAGCFADEVEKISRLQAASRLVDQDGKPVR
jgi:hypothetical protein